MANEYYAPRTPPIEFERTRAARIAGEHQSIESAFDRLPDLNRMYGAGAAWGTEEENSNANVIIFTSTLAFTELTAGVHIEYLALRGNTGACTINVDGLGLTSVVRGDQSPLQAGDIRAEQVVQMLYDGRRWRLLQYATAATALYFTSAVPNPELTVNEEMTPVVFPVAAGGTSPYAYDIVGGLPTGLSFEAATRTLSGIPSVIGVSAGAEYRATDADSTTVVAAFTINVVQNALTLPDPADQSMTVGTQTSTTMPAARGGSGGYTYRMNGLPPGITFDPASRRMFGSPTEAGVYTTVQYFVTDSDNNTREQVFTIEVRTNQALALQGVSDRRMTINVAIGAITLPAATGGSPPYTYSVTDLPNGLSFNENTRQISGTPDTLTGSSGATVTYAVADNRGISQTITFRVIVSEGGQRYTAIIDDGGTVTAGIITAGVGHSVTDRVLRLPVWTGEKKIVIAQPASRDDLTYVSLSGVGNAVSAFTKGASTVTIGAVEYEYWLGNDVQGGVISGENLNVQP